MSRIPVESPDAPKAIGAYSQAIRAGRMVYLSGQIPLDPASLKLVQGDFEALLERVLDNLEAVAKAAGGSLTNLVKLNVYLVDLSNYARVNEVMQRRFAAPYPARAVIGVAALPLGAPVEVDGILELPSEDYSY